MQRTVRIAALVSAALLSLSAQASVISASPNLAIPDNSSTGVSSTLFVSGIGHVAQMTVSVALNHSWIGDLLLTLSHGGQTVVLMDRPGGVDNNVGDNSNLSASFPLLFTSSATEAAESMGSNCGTNHVVGQAANCVGTTFLPQQPFTPFLGQPLAGDWILNVVDKAALDVGSLVSWSLDLTPATTPVLSTNQAATAVPEPASLALLGAGLAAALAARRRRA